MVANAPRKRPRSRSRHRDDPQTPTIPLPVTCPRCGVESLTDFPVIVVRVALTQWNQLALYSSCHEDAWDASPGELEKIRRHVGPAWLEDPHPPAVPA